MRWVKIRGFPPFAKNTKDPGFTTTRPSHGSVYGFLIRNKPVSCPCGSATPVDD
jgi:hypothetical protein